MGRSQQGLWQAPRVLRLEARTSCRSATPLLCILAMGPFGETSIPGGSCLLLEYSEEYSASSITHQHLLRDTETLNVMDPTYPQCTKHQAKVNRVLESLLRPQGSQHQPSGSSEWRTETQREGTSLSWQLEVSQSDLSQPPHQPRAEQGPG